MDIDERLAQVSSRSEEGRQLDRMLAEGAPVNHRYSYGRTALWNCIDHECQHAGVHKIKLLLAYGADPNIADMRGCRPLARIFPYSANLGQAILREIEELLRQHGARYGIELFDAILDSDASTVTRILDAECDLQEARPDSTPAALAFAARWGMQDMVELLLARAPSVAAFDAAVEVAIALNHTECVRALSANRHKVSRGDTDSASRDHRLEAMKNLLARDRKSLQDRATPRTTEVGLSGLLELPAADTATLLSRDSPVIRWDWQEVGRVAARAVARGHDGFIDVLVEFLAQQTLDLAAAVDRKRNTPLHVAAMTGARSLADLLIARGADTNARNRAGATPLHGAVADRLGEHLEVYPKAVHRRLVDARNRIISLLVAAGASPDARDRQGRTPLHEAVQCGRETAVRALMVAGANVTAVRKGGLTALHDAARLGHVKIAELLLDGGADPHAMSKSQRTAVTLAIEAYQPAILKLIMERGMIAKGSQKPDAALLPRVAAWDRPDIVEMLIQRGADVNDPIVLVRAAEAGWPDVVKCLLANGACVTSAALCRAGVRGHGEVFDLLLSEGGADRGSDLEGVTLHSAVLRGSYEMVEWMIKLGADVNARSDCTFERRSWGSALHLAAREGHGRIARLLIRSGAEVNAECQNFIDGETESIETPITVAIQNGHTGIAELLASSGSS